MIYLLLSDSLVLPVQLGAAGQASVGAARVLAEVRNACRSPRWKGGVPLRESGLPGVGRCALSGECSELNTSGVLAPIPQSVGYERTSCVRILFGYRVD